MITRFAHPFALTMLLASASGVHAHALLERANPRVGNTVAAAPPVLSLWFSQELEPAFTSIEVVNAAGARVDAGRTRVEAATAQVGLKPLPPGVYMVRWRALSVDTHRTQGSFTFEVRP